MQIIQIFIKIITRKILSLFRALTSSPEIGGFMISESALQYVSLGSSFATYVLRIPPGVISDGKIIDFDAAKKIFQEFRRMVNPHTEIPLKVIVTLPASLIYTQSFSVPNLNDEKLHESIDLNLQMLSPMPKEEVYMSGEILATLRDRVELLGAFAEKKHIDMYRALCDDARFTPLAFEFPGRALTRLVSTELRSAGSLLLFSLSSDGINIMVLRSGKLYFDYFRPWHSIQGSLKDIPQSVFESAVVHEIQKVIHFSLSRFQETPERIFLIAPGFEQMLIKLFAQSISVPVTQLTFSSWSTISPQWYGALGSALRGIMDRSEDRELSIAPQGSLQLFYEERTLHFICRWRNIMASVAGFLFVIFGFSAYFLIQQVAVLKNEVDNAVYVPRKELLATMNRASEFNALVRTVREGKAVQESWNTLVRRIETVMLRERVTLDRLEIGGLQSVMTLVAHAPDYDAVGNFKTAMTLDTYFLNVVLLSSSVIIRDDGMVGFTLTFRRGNL